MDVNDQFIAGSGMLLDLHGEEQSWTPAAGGAATGFTGVYESEYFDASVGVAVMAAKPSMIVRTADVAGIVRGDTVTVTSTLHGISAAAYALEHKQDAPADLGPGLSRLILKR